jgi:undecaprenyl diphosphate synthase
MDKDTKEKKIPNHVGIIIDGNRRWAKERNLPAFEGHNKGFRKLKQVPSWFFSRGVKIVSVYAFSTENWSRTPEEVNFLMKLIRQGVDEIMETAEEKKTRVLFSGRLSELPGDLPEACQEVMNRTKHFRDGIFNICLNYGGRAEIIDAIRKIVNNNVTVEQIHEGMLKKYFYQPDLADPDIIVRTSGEQRTSNFLLWQAAYSELFFMKKYWPDFEELDAVAVINEYNQRERRLGGDAPKEPVKI